MAFFKTMWRGNSRHKKLCEEWALTNTDCKDPQPTDYASDGVTFHVKYLGSTLVETPSNEKATAEAIKTIITLAKASGRKLSRVSLHVSLHGIRVVDAATDDVHVEVSIYRVSYCSADAAHGRVTAFITANADETMECHAFLCAKRKVAQAVTLAVAHSFNTVYELWQSAQTSQPQDAEQNFPGFCAKLDAETRSQKSLLIDLSFDEPGQPNSWVSFDADDDRPAQTTPVYSPQRLKPAASAWGDMTLLL